MFHYSVQPKAFHRFYKGKYTYVKIFLFFTLCWSKWKLVESKKLPRDYQQITPHYIDQILEKDRNWIITLF